MYFIVLMPLAIHSGFNAFSLQRVVSGFEGSLHDVHQEKIRDIERQLNNLAVQLDRIAINLSRPREISHALEAADNEVLFDWSISFIDQIDSIVFASGDGIVIARAPNEFRFGDDISSADYFQIALANGSFQGVCLVDDRLSLVTSRSVLKYNDLPVGVVCVVMHITPAMLDRIVTDEYAVLTATAPEESVASARISSPVHRTFAIEPARLIFRAENVFTVEILEDIHYRELVSLKRSLIRNSILAGLLTLVVLLLIARWQFSPYTRMVDAILAYSDKKEDMPDLRNRLVMLKKNTSGEVERICSALTRMIDVIGQNFKYIEELNCELKQLANRDPLTRLFNRRGMSDALEAEIERAKRYGSPLSVVMSDIDHFKRLNDSKGHQYGDRVLQTVGDTLAGNSRSSDIVCRWGGEEFCILCPGNDLDEAVAFAEKLREIIPGVTGDNSSAVTVSFGVAQFQKDETGEAFLARADKALYKAKKQGRNRVVSG